MKVNQLQNDPKWAGPLKAFDDSINTHWIPYYIKYKTKLLLATRLNPSLHGLSMTNNEIMEIEVLLRQKITNASSSRPNPIEAQNQNFGFLTWHQMNLANPDLQAPDELTQFVHSMSLITENPYEFDLWKYWQEHKDHMPILNGIASEVYSIPASSAASERGFSRAKNLQAGKRIRLTGKKLEDQLLVCENPSLIP